MDLTPLWERAFLSGEAREANTLLAEARERCAALAPGARSVFSYEVVVPDAAGEAWLAETLLPRLVYHCESRRAPLPECAGVFVSAFVGDRLFCVFAADVIAFAREALGLDDAALVAAYGTGEVRHALRPPAPSPRTGPPPRRLGTGHAPK